MRRAVVATAILALGLSLAAFLLLIGLPCFVMTESGSANVSVENGAVVVERHCVSLIEATDARVLYLLLAPVFLTALYLLSSLRRWKVAAVPPVLFLGLFVLLTGFSIGLFFVPATLVAGVSLAFLLTSGSGRPTEVPRLNG